MGKHAHTSISANFPQNTALIKISPKIALFEVPVEPYKNRTISRIALIKVSLMYTFWSNQEVSKEIIKNFNRYLVELLLVDPVYLFLF